MKLPTPQALRTLPYMLSHFLAYKTKREKLLLALAMALLVVFVGLDFIYLPLFERLSQLSQLRAHAQSELSSSQLLLQNKQDLLSNQSLERQESLTTTEQNLTLLQSYMKKTLRQEELLNPFTLMPRLISLSKQGHFSLSVLTPYAGLHALLIKGNGSLEGVKTLLAFLETYQFLSLEYITLRPHHNANDENLDFELLVLDPRLVDNQLFSRLAMLPDSESVDSEKLDSQNKASREFVALINTLKESSQGEKAEIKKRIEGLHTTHFSPQGSEEIESLILEATFNTKALVSGRWLQKGERINGYTLVEVLPTSITLRKGSNLYSLSLLHKGINKLEP